MKVILIMTTSADGFITRDPTQDTVWDKEYDAALFEPLTQQIGTVVMGANTYSLMSGPLDDRHNIVMTSVPKETDDARPNLEFFAGTPKELIAALDDRDIEEVALIGGAQINGSFLSENLVDEIYLTVTPELFGEGVSLASGYPLETKLKLLEARPIANDTAALLHFEVLK